MTLDLIAKKYRVLKPLGQGAMGDVYLVLPPRGDPVALKLLKTQDGGGDKGALEQFENEFMVLKKLSHPNIAKIHDFGYDTELKKVYFTSPWLKGKDLYQTSKDYPYDKFEELLVQTLRALNYLHQKGIIHCDLKPGNIFVEDGQVLLIDFGLAAYWGESIVGTPTYLAPEIFRGEHHSVSSDLYALGVVLYNCLTRTQPFAGKSIQEVYDRHRQHLPVPIHELNSNVPAYLSDLVHTLLAKKISDRYSSAVTVIDELAAFSQKTYSVETQETLMSYLPKHSELIGRGDVLWRLETQISEFMEKKGAMVRGIFLYGEHGLGKTKFINQIKNTLQVAHVQVEEAILPLKEGDKRILQSAEVIIFEDLDNLLSAIGDKNASQSATPGTESTAGYFQEFLAFLEQKLLSTETQRFLFIVSGAVRSDWECMKRLFPEDEYHVEPIELFPFSEIETKKFLGTIIGNVEIPKTFIEEIFRNTGGNPGLCQQIVETLIKQGLLFDDSGRWSHDLLSNLDGILKKIEPPKSLEERLDREYMKFDDQEKEVVHYLAVSPHGLTEIMLAQLVGKVDVAERLKSMKTKKVIRLELDGQYYLYRSAFSAYLQKFIPEQELQSLHKNLASDELGLEPIHQWFHQSHRGDPILMQSALEKLGEKLAQDGEKERALECYQRLNKAFLKIPIPERLKWVIKSADILIWLDRFLEAENLITDVENDIYSVEDSIPIRDRLTLLEKKGLALLHRHKLKQASFYFMEGQRLATNQPGCEVEEIRAGNNMAQIEMITGKHDEAIKQFQQSRARAEPLGPKRQKLITNNDLGHVYLSLKKYEQAVVVLQEDITVFSALPFHEPESRARYSLAECYRALQKTQEAIQEYKSCIAICQKERLFPVLLRAFNGLGNLYLVNGDYERALDNYQRAIEISVHLKDAMTKAALLANQGLIYRSQANYAQASRRFQLAKQILENKNSKLIAYENHLLCKCYAELAAIARETKDGMKAISFQMEQVRLVEASPTLNSERFSVKMELAELYLANRLSGPLELELAALKIMAGSEDEKKRVKTLELKWLEVKTYIDVEGTNKIESPFE